MSQLMIFKYNGAEIRTVIRNGEPWFYINDVCDFLNMGYCISEKRLVNKYDILAMADCYLADGYSKEKYRKAKLLLRFAKASLVEEDETTFWCLYEAMLMNLIWIKNVSTSEYALQDLFKKKVKDLFSPQAEIIKVATKKRNYPDVFVKLKDEIIPVEVKLDLFDSKALKQLQRYMAIYKTTRGIAVAKTLDVSLPNNIRFIPLEIE